MFRIAVLIGGLVVSACAGLATQPAPPKTSEPPAVPTPSLEPTKPPRTQEQLPLPTKVRFAIDERPEHPDKPWLILFLDGMALGLTVIDSAGSKVFDVPIAGSGIFGEGSCVARVPHSQGLTTWAWYERSVLDAFVANHASYRLVAHGVPSGSAIIPIEDTGCRSGPP